jgi:hypothetical protein
VSVAQKPNEKTGKPAHDRKFGKQVSVPLPIWNGILEPCHVTAIGPALWEFLWLINRVTEEDQDGIGWCLGKSPIKTERVAEELGEHVRTAGNNLLRLTSAGYLIRKRTPYGYIMGVRNSRKFSAFRPKRDSQETITLECEKEGTTENTDSQKTPERMIENARENDSFRPRDSQFSMNESLLRRSKEKKESTEEGEEVAAAAALGLTRSFGKKQLVQAWTRIWKNAPVNIDYLDWIELVEKAIQEGGGPSRQIIEAKRQMVAMQWAVIPYGESLYIKELQEKNAREDQEFLEAMREAKAKEIHRKQ